MGSFEMQVQLDFRQAIVPSGWLRGQAEGWVDGIRGHSGGKQVDESAAMHRQLLLMIQCGNRFELVVSEGDHRVDSTRPAGWHVRRRERRRSEKDGDAA